MNTGPFPVDKRSAQALARAESGLAVMLHPRDTNPTDSDTALSDTTVTARAGMATARRFRPSPGSSLHSPPSSPLRSHLCSPLRSPSGLKILPNSSALTAEAAEEEGINPPERIYDCPNYETCLGLAAALDWKSFTCHGCCGEVNQQLLWRAHHRIRNNPSLTKLCNLPV